MSVGAYNQGRSVSDLKLKTWEYGKAGNLRSDSLWQDDKYHPIKQSHPFRYDNVNFPEQEYKDIFGGTLGTQEQKEQEYYQISAFSDNSKAMTDYKKEKREKNALKNAVHEVNAHNATDSAGHGAPRSETTHGEKPKQEHH